MAKFGRDIEIVSSRTPKVGDQIARHKLHVSKLKLTADDVHVPFLNMTGNIATLNLQPSLPNV